MRPRYKVYRHRKYSNWSYSQCKAKGICTTCKSNNVAHKAVMQDGKIAEKRPYIRCFKCTVESREYSKKYARS